MPKVPLYEPQVRTVRREQPKIEVGRVPEAAFGGAVGQAQQQFGSTLQQVGERLSDSLIRLEQQKQEQQVLELQNQAQQEIQTKLYDETQGEDERPVGFLVRQRNSAFGSVPEFDKVAEGLKRSYLAQAKSPFQRDLMGKTLDAHLGAAREQVIRHEAAERSAAYEDTLKANMSLTISSAAGYSDPRDLEKVVANAAKDYARAVIPLGYDPKVVAANTFSYTGQIVKSAVMAQLNSNPVQAAAILKKFQPSLLPDDYNALKTTVDGKLFDVRQLQAWEVAKGFKMADGTMDIGRIEKYAFSQPVNPEQKKALFSYLHSMASIEDSITADKIKANDRAFTNKIVEDLHNKVPPSEAMQHVMDFARDQADAEKKMKDVVDIYTGNAFDKLLSTQGEAEKLAWEDIKQAATEHFSSWETVEVDGQPRDSKEAFLTEMKRATLGKSAEQMREILKKKLELMPKKHFWNSTQERWLADANARVNNTEAVAEVAKYPPYLVAATKAFLATQGIAPTPSAILANITLGLKLYANRKRK